MSEKFIDLDLDVYNVMKDIEKNNSNHTLFYARRDGDNKATFLTIGTNEELMLTMANAILSEKHFEKIFIGALLVARDFTTNDEQDLFDKKFDAMLDILNG